MKFTRSLLAVLLLAAAAPARCEVTSVDPAGFEVRHAMHVAAPPDKAYALLITPARWWNAEHTYSQNAANLSLDAKAGGCFCEKLAHGGSVEHMRTLFAAPGKLLRLRGALGPFQGLAVSGVLTVTLEPAGSGSDLTLSYVIGGRAPQGFDALSKAADGMLGEQFAALGKLLGT